MYCARKRKQHILLTSCKYGKYVNITFYSHKSGKLEFTQSKVINTFVIPNYVFSLE